MENEAIISILENIASNNSDIISHLINIEHGLKILMSIAVAFLVWKVITVIYKLFAGVFFGGV